MKIGACGASRTHRGYFVLSEAVVPVSLIHTGLSDGSTIVNELGTDNFHYARSI